MAVPTSAPTAVFWFAGAPGIAPICCAAHCLQTASSAWNCSKGFPGAGMTITLGPVGNVAHPPKTSAARKEKRLRVRSISHHSYRPGEAGEGTTFIQALGHCLTYG
jgi:hypothetical protein